MPSASVWPSDGRAAALALFPLLRREPAANELQSARILLRPPHASDHGQWRALRKASRAFLQPWEPKWPDDEFTAAAWRERMRRYQREASLGSGQAWFLFLEDGTLAGGIALGNIRRGVAQNGQIGYWMGAEHAGKGLMDEALELIVPHAFSTLGLHRLEAACIPGNTRSMRLLEKAGFEREGLMRSYLKIGGRWQDHYLYARIRGTHQGNGNQA